MTVNTAVVETIEGPWELSKGWKWMRLGSILKLKYGQALTESARDSQGKYAVFGSSGRIGQHSRAKTKGPTIIIGRKGTLGLHFFSPDPCWPIDTTIYIDNFPENINPKYIYFFLKSLNLQKLNKKQTIPGLTAKDINDCLIPIPFPKDDSQSLIIQNQRAFYMEETLKNIEECQQLINQMQTDLNLLIHAELEQTFGNKRDGATVKNVLPEQIKKLKEIASYSRGKRLGKNSDYFGGDTPWVEIHDLPKDYSKYIAHYTKNSAMRV